MLAPRPALADARAIKPSRGAPRLDDERRETTDSATTLWAFSSVRRKTGVLAPRPARAKARAIKHCEKMGVPCPISM